MNTVTLHRVLKAPPSGYTRPLSSRTPWPNGCPHGFTCKVAALDARVGGQFRMSFTHFASGHPRLRRRVSRAGAGQAHPLHRPLRRPQPAGEMQVTITLTQVLCGTDLAIEQAGIPAVIPVEMCYLGWQESLMQLATLVEPEIPAE